MFENDPPTNRFKIPNSPNKVANLNKDAAIIPLVIFGKITLKND